jgi:hypothetical protein
MNHSESVKACQKETHRCLSSLVCCVSAQKNNWNVTVSNCFLTVMLFVHKHDRTLLALPVHCGSGFIIYQLHAAHMKTEGICMCCVACT